MNSRRSLRPDAAGILMRMGARLRFKFFGFVILVAATVVVAAACSGSEGGTNSPTTEGGTDTGTDMNVPPGEGGGPGGPKDAAVEADAGADADADAHPPLTGTYLWAKRFGNDPAGTIAGEVAVDGSGNIVVAGRFTKSVDFGGGLLSATGMSVFVAKFDPTGKHLWSKRFGDATGLPAGANQPAIDAAGNIYVVGGFDGTINFGGADLTSAGGDDAFVAKFDPNGNHLWSKRFGGSGTEGCTGVAVNGANIVLLGTFTSTIDFGGGGLSPAPGQFLATLTASAGDHVWSKVPANVSATTALYEEHVRVDGSGNIVFAGGFTGSIDFGSGALTPPGNGENVFVAKFAANGAYTWSKRFGDSNQEIAKDIALDSAGNIILTGDGSGTLDFGTDPISFTPGVFAAKLDATGKGTWAKGFSFTNGNAGAVAVDSFGDILLSGNYSGQVNFGLGALSLHDGSDGSRAAYVAKLDAAGVAAWSKAWNGSGASGSGLNASAGSSAFDSSGNVIITAGFAGTIDVGGGSLTSTSSTGDLLLGKFAP